MIKTGGREVEQVYLVPKKGVLIRHPRSKEIIPEEGCVVPWTGPEGRFFRRRVNDGSAKIRTKKPEIKKEKEAKKVYKFKKEAEE